MKVNKLVFQMNDSLTEYCWQLLIIVGLAF